VLLAVLTLALAPEARAQEQLGKDEPPPEVLPPTPSEYRLQLRRTALETWFEPHAEGWAVASIAPGVLALGGVLALPFRPRGSPEFCLVLTLAWIPSVVGLATLGGIHQAIRSRESPLETWRRLEAGTWILTFSAVTAWLVSVLAAVGVGMMHPLFIFPVAAVPVALTVSAAMMGTWARRVRRSLLTERGSRRPGPRLLALGPTGVVVEF